MQSMIIQNIGVPDDYISLSLSLSLSLSSLQFHVTAGERPTLDKGYVTTEAPPTDSTYHPSVYALDCEMCYTTAGLQLTRVSVINMSLQPIYEKLVKPSHPIVDYNTRYDFHQTFQNKRSPIHQKLTPFSWLKSSYNCHNTL